MTAEQPHSWLATLLPFAIVAVILVLRIRTMRRERPLDLKRIWLVPVVYLAIIAFMFVELPPSLLGWELFLGGLLIGLLTGWYRGRLIHIYRDAETGELRQKASPLALFMLVAIIILKIGARDVFGETAASNASSPAMVLTDGFIGFALGLLSATRIEMFTRARRLLAGG